LVVSSHISPATADPKRFVEYQTFAQWQALVPELNGARYCGLTEAAHEMWARGDLRMPREGFVHVDLAGSGQDQWAIPLRPRFGPEACNSLLLAMPDGTGGGAFSSPSQTIGTWRHVRDSRQSHETRGGRRGRKWHPENS
jgi:hypothetical protein